MVAVCWPRWLPRPYMVNTFKNLLLQNRESLGAESLQESLGTGGLPKLLKKISYIDIWPFYGKVKFASLCICMRKTFKNLLLQNRVCLMAESLHISSRMGGLPKIAKIMVIHWHLTFLRLGQFCFLKYLYGKNVQNLKQLLLWSLWANFAQISYEASLGKGNKRLLKWSRFVDQDGRDAHIW